MVAAQLVRKMEEETLPVTAALVVVVAIVDVLIVGVATVNYSDTLGYVSLMCTNTSLGCIEFKLNG